MEHTMDTAPQIGLVLDEHAAIAEVKELLRKIKQSKDDAKQYEIEIGRHLKILKTTKPKGTRWSDYVRIHFGLRQSRADQLIRVAEGRTTVAKERQDTASRVKKHSQKKSALANADVEKKPSGVAIKVPEGYSSLGEAIRAAVEMERNGVPAIEVAKQLKLAIRTYQIGRDLVLLSDLPDLSESDTECVQNALRYFNEQRRIPRDEDIKAIATKVWGNKGNRFKAEARAEAFCNSVSFVLTICNATSEMAIPHLDNVRRDETAANVNEAINSLQKLHRRILRKD
jgi:hypothetical protein